MWLERSIVWLLEKQEKVDDLFAGNDALWGVFSQNRMEDSGM